MMAAVDWIPSQRGERVLLHNNRGYHVTMKRGYDDYVDMAGFGGGVFGIHMVVMNVMCTNRNNTQSLCKCSGKVLYNTLTDTYENFVLNDEHEVWCTWDENNVILEKMKVMLYQKLRDKVYTDVSDAWHWAMNELDIIAPGLSMYFPRVSSFKTKAAKIIKGDLPNLPKQKDDLDGLHIPEQLTVTLSNQPFLLLQHTFDHAADDKHPNGSRETIMVFGNWTRFQEMCEAQVAFADGTFQVCPHPFYQLYIIHIVHANGVRMRPCVWCLLTRKTGQIYSELFTQLRQLAQQRGHPIIWTKFRTDFEVAVMNTVAEVFPGLTVTGCFFHFCSAIIKKLREMGFGPDYANSVTYVKVTAKSIMGLAFLPPLIVADTFTEICNDYNNPPANAAARPNLDMFFLYVQSSWIDGGVAEVGRWTIGNLNSKRTNNDLEGYHSRLLAKFKRHPNLWKFIKTLQTEEKDIQQELEHLDTGIVPRVAANILAREEDVRVLKQRYSDNLITAKQLAKQIGFLTSVSD